MRVEMDLRNLKLFRLMEYLVEAGGQPTGERSVSGAGWQAEIHPLAPIQLHTMRIPRDLLVIEGEEAAIVEKIHQFMRSKTMRGGG